MSQQNRDRSRGGSVGSSRAYGGDALGGALGRQSYESGYSTRDDLQRFARPQPRGQGPIRKASLRTQRRPKFDRDRYSNLGVSEPVESAPVNANLLAISPSPISDSALDRLLAARAARENPRRAAATADNSGDAVVVELPLARRIPEGGVRVALHDQSERLPAEAFYNPESYSDDEAARHVEELQRQFATADSVADEYASEHPGPAAPLDQVGVASVAEAAGPAATVSPVAPARPAARPGRAARAQVGLDAVPAPGRRGAPDTEQPAAAKIEQPAAASPAAADVKAPPATAVAQPAVAPQPAVSAQPAAVAPSEPSGRRAAVPAPDTTTREIPAPAVDPRTLAPVQPTQPVQPAPTRPAAVQPQPVQPTQPALAPAATVRPARPLKSDDGAPFERMPEEVAAYEAEVRAASAQSERSVGMYAVRRVLMFAAIGVYALACLGFLIATVGGSNAPLVNSVLLVVGALAIVPVCIPDRRVSNPVRANLVRIPGYAALLALVALCAAGFASGNVLMAVWPLVIFVSVALIRFSPPRR
ncbi:hypothetical protein JT358_07080 [Micrococcales bacterium 31B]|nr:hypothetical protein [Micrococcales bacterium 31B]